MDVGHYEIILDHLLWVPSIVQINAILLGVQYVQFQNQSVLAIWMWGHYEIILDHLQWVPSIFQINPIFLWNNKGYHICNLVWYFWGSDMCNFRINLY